MQGKKNNVDNSQYPLRIKALRAATGLTQYEFAEVLGFDRSMLAGYESTEHPKRPSSSFFISLGNLAAENRRYEDAIWFWEQGGIRGQNMIPAVLDIVKELDAPLVQGSLTTVPANKCLQLPDDKERRVPFPTALLPNPLAVSFVAVNDDALEPLYKRGDVLIVDESNADIWKMIGSRVVAYRAASWSESVRKSREKLTDAEFEKYLPDRSGRIGLYAGWLRSTSRGAESIVVIESPNILGSISSTPIAFELSAIHGSSIKRKIDVPEFIVLGTIVASITPPRVSPTNVEQSERGKKTANSKAAKRKQGTARGVDEIYGEKENAKSRSKKPAKRKK